MDRPILELLPQSGEKHLELSWLPAQHARKQANPDALVALGVVDELVLAYLLELLVLRPGVYGDLEEVLLDVHKACIFYPLLVLGVDGNRFAILLRGFDDFRSVEEVHMALCCASIVGP